MILRLLLLFGFLQISHAQNKLVKGVVSSEGRALEGASVIVYGSKIGTITDAMGAFVLNISNVKNPRIIISYLGHKSFIQKIKQKDLGNISLEIDDQLEEVVVSGTLKPVSKLDSPVPVESYTQTFFKANPTPSIFEALEIVNGIRPQLNCNVCNTGDIHINGQEGSYTMVLIDGLPIVSGLSTVYGLSGIPQSLIERIEVIKGPASTLYGSEAIGGVINLITKIPENANKLSFDSFVSSWGEVNTDIGYKYKLSDKSRGLLGVNYFNYLNPIDNNDDGFTDLTIQDRVSIFNKIDIGEKLSIATRFVYEDRWGGQVNWNRNFRGGDQIYGESIYTSRVEFFGNYKFNKDLSLQFSFNNHNQDSVYGTTIFNANQTIGFGQFIWSKSILKNDFLIGMVYRYTSYDDDTTATFDDKSLKNNPEKTHLPGIFIQDEIEFNEQNTLLLGMRYDYNSIHGNIFTPRLNYKTSNKKQTSIFRLSMGSGYRVNQVFTEDHAALTGAREVVFLNNLKPERSWNMNLNFMKKIYLNRGYIIDLDSSVFRTIFSNKIIPNYDSNPNQIIYDNLNGTSVIQGVSVNINTLFQNNLRLNLGLTYIDSYIEEKGVKSTPYLTESFQGVWRVEKNINRYGLSLHLTGSITGPMRLPLLSEIDPRASFSPTFSIINFQLTKKWNNTTEFYCGAKNILDFTPAKNSIARPNDPFDRDLLDNNPYQLNFDPSYVYASNQGIRFFFGLRWNLN
tara:strand:- start:471 stop:2678 length:2208 start_codon:yes stop_codon:yes gene_type:complete